MKARFASAQTGCARLASLGIRNPAARSIHRLAWWAGSWRSPAYRPVSSAVGCAQLLFRLPLKKKKTLKQGLEFYVRKKGMVRLFIYYQNLALA